MKEHEPNNLIFYTLHSRRVHGCLPFFLLVAAAFLFACFYLVKVVVPESVHSAGLGRVYYRSDLMTRFAVRQQSMLPLLLPAAADEAPDSRPLSLLREVKPCATPPVQVYPDAPDSVVLRAESLLELPPADTEEEEEEKGGEP